MRKDTADSIMARYERQGTMAMFNLHGCRFVEGTTAQRQGRHEIFLDDGADVTLELSHATGLSAYWLIGMCQYA